MRASQFITEYDNNKKQGDMFPHDFASKRTTNQKTVTISSKGDTETLRQKNTNSMGQQISGTKSGLARFWQWFGDSTAVDSKDRPIVMFHSTNHDFRQFKTNIKTWNDMGILGAVETSRAGIFVSPNAKMSQEYLRGDSSTVMPLYIKAENPFDMRNGLSEVQESALAATGVNLRWVLSRDTDWEKFDDDDGKQFVKALQAAGYDSAIFNETSPMTGKPMTTYVLFSGKQLKSAIGNRGSYDNSDDIISEQSLFELGDASYPFKSSNADSDGAMYVFKNADGKKTTAEFVRHGKYYGFAFSDFEGKHDLTGTAKDSLRIMTTIVNIMKDFISIVPECKNIVFSSDISEPSRIKLYDRFANSVEKYIPGWKLKDKWKASSLQKYLISNEQELTESKSDYNTETVYYHGTASKTNFPKFKIGKGGIDELGRGIYVTSKPYYANFWAGRGGEEEGGRIIPLYLKRGELFDLDRVRRYINGIPKETMPFWIQLAQRVKKYRVHTDIEPSGSESLWKTWLEESDEALAEYILKTSKMGQLNNWLARAGYIGAYSDYSQIPGQVVVFDSRYLKSSIGNKGKYDPTKPDFIKESALTELNDSSYPFKRLDGNKYGVRINDKMIGMAKFSQEDSYTAFYFTTGTKNVQTVGLTGEMGGLSIKILSTVINIIKDYFSENPGLDELRFSAKRTEPSRVKLYDRFVNEKTISKYMPEWELTSRETIGASIYYTIKKREQISESKLADNIFKLEDAIINSICVQIEFSSISDNKKIPRTIDKLTDSGYLLDNFNNIISKSFMFKALEIFRSVGINKTNVTIMNDNDLKPGSAGYYTSPNGRIVIVVSSTTVDQLQKSWEKWIYTSIKKLFKIRDIDKIFDEIIIATKKWGEELKKSPDFIKFAQLILHELTHAAQNEKMKMPLSNFKNMKGNNIGLVYFQKIAKGILDIDYYSQPAEIDAYANELAAKIKQKYRDTPYTLKTIQNDIFHPVFNMIKTVAHEENSKLHMDIWKRFVKKVVQNLN